MGVFAIGIIVFVILTISLNKKKASRLGSNIIIPFAGYLSPPNTYWTVKQNQNNVGTAATPDGGLRLVGSVGGKSNDVPQIQCPVGTSINILGAFIEVNDPYMECQDASDPTYALSCGSLSNASSASTCSVDTDCPTGMNCTGGICLPGSCAVNSDCTQKGNQDSPLIACPDGSDPSAPNEGVGITCKPSITGSPTRGSKWIQLVCVPDPSPNGDPPTTGTWMWDPAYGQCIQCNQSSKTCANIPLCDQNSTSTTIGQNSTCQNSNCKIRDASAYLGKYCDGKNECLGSNSDYWIPNSPGTSQVPNPFGPLPCNISASVNDPNYSKLPIIPGWNAGNIPLGGNSSAPANFSQGYYVHGVYTCIPDDQRSQPSTQS